MTNWNMGRIYLELAKQSYDHGSSFMKLEI